MKNKTVLKSRKESFSRNRFLVLLWYIAISLIEYAMIDIFANAGFDWRNPCMEYTQKGKLITSVLLVIPIFLLLAVIWFRLVYLFYQHKSVWVFLMEISVSFLGVCLTFFICFLLTASDLLPEWIVGIRHYLMKLIKESDWMYWPPP